MWIAKSGPIAMAPTWNFCERGSACAKRGSATFAAGGLLCLLHARIFQYVGPMKRTVVQQTIAKIF